MTLLRFFPLVSLVLLGASPSPPFQALFVDGQVAEGTLHVSSSKKDGKRGEFRGIPAKRDRENLSPSLSFRGVRLFRNQNPFQTVRQIGPQFQFQLWGGERVSGEIATRDSETLGKLSGLSRFNLPVLVRGENRRTVTEYDLTAVLTPRNERLVFYQDFETNAEAWTLGSRPAESKVGEHRSGRRSLPLPRSGEAILCRLAQFPAQGRIQWQLAERIAAPQEAKTTPENQQTGWRLEFQLSDLPPNVNPSVTSAKQVVANTWVVQTDGQSYTSTATPDLRMVTLPVVRRPGWRQWTLRLSEDRTLLCVDGEVLVTGPALSQRLVSFTLQALPEHAKEAVPATAPGVSKEAAPGKTSTVSIDDLLILEAANPAGELPLPRNSQPRDLLWMTTGDELFGTPSDLSATGLAMKLQNRSRQFPWGSVAGLMMRHPATIASDVAADLAPARGWQTWVELSNGQWSHMRQSDRLCLALQEIDGDTLTAEHSLLGRLRIPLREVSQIEPLFFGERRILETAAYHLGDETRDDFSVPVPGGSQLERTLTIDRLPVGQCFCSLQVEDLEPSGPQTPDTSPNLAALQAGHLQTVLFVNGRSIGDINRYISQKAAPGQPLRLRVPLPEGALQVGKNTFRLKQSPASDDPQNFDDFQVSQWAVEWDQGE